MTLTDVSVNTFIGKLPDIINSNNDTIEQAFSDIYDASTSVLKKGVVTTSNIDAAEGRFNNIYLKDLSKSLITIINDFEQRIKNLEDANE